MLLLNIYSIFSVCKRYIPNSCLVCLTQLRSIIDLNLLIRKYQKMIRNQFSESKSGFNCFMFEYSDKNPFGTDFLRGGEPATATGTGCS